MPPSATADDHRLRILFLSAHPTSTGERRRIGEELRAVEHKILRAPHRDALALESRWAVRPTDLQEALLEVRPHVVHFSGRGTEEEAILLEDDDGGPQPVSKAALGQLFSILKDNLRAVVLNACHSRAQAEVFVEHIDCAVGMRRALPKDAAVAFAAAFYSALAFGRSIGGVGKTALALELAHRHAGNYPGGVWWLAAEGKPLDGLVRLAGILKAGAPLDMKARVDLGAPEAEPRLSRCSSTPSPSPRRLMTPTTPPSPSGSRTSRWRVGT